MKIKFLIFLLILFSVPSFAQAIKGKIVNEFNQPIQDTNIYNKKTDSHSHSNEKGEFTLENCAIGDILQISFIGYQSQLIEIKNLNEFLTIILHKETINLEEITISPKINMLHIISLLLILKF